MLCIERHTKNNQPLAMSLASPDELGGVIEDGSKVGVIDGLWPLSARGRGGELAAGSRGKLGGSLIVESTCRESRGCWLSWDDDLSCCPLP